MRVHATTASIGLYKHVLGGFDSWNKSSFSSESCIAALVRIALYTRELHVAICYRSEKIAAKLHYTMNFDCFASVPFFSLATRHSLAGAWFIVLWVYSPSKIPAIQYKLNFLILPREGTLNLNQHQPLFALTLLCLPPPPSPSLSFSHKMFVGRVVC